MKITYKKGLLSLLFLSAGTLLGAFSAFFVQMIIARNLEPADFGEYNTFLSVINILAPLCGFGMSQFLLKVFGQYGERGYLFVKPIFKFIIFTTILTFVLFCVVMSYLYYNTQYYNISLLMTFVLFGQLSIEIVSSILQLEEKYKQLSLWQALLNCLRLMFLLLVILVFNKLTLNYIVIIYIVISLLLFIIGLPKIINFINHNIGLLGYLKKDYDITQDKLEILYLAKKAAPFGLAGMFFFIYYQIGIIFVNLMVSAESAGYYSIGLLIINSSMLLPIVIYNKFLLPKLHRWAYHSPKKLWQTYKIGNLIMGGLGILAACVLWVVLPFFIELFFGANYLNAVSLCQWMLINIPLSYLSSNAGAMLVTGNNMIIKVKIQASTAMLNVACTYFALKFWELDGIIVSMFITNLYLLIMYNYANWKHVFVEEIKDDRK